MRHPLETTYAWPAQDACGPSLFELIGDRAVRLDPDGVLAAFGERHPTSSTCVAGIRLAPSWFSGEGREPSPHAAGLRALLEEACARVPASGAALALSGGVDSAILLALLPRTTRVYTLAAEFPGYGEEEEARAVAQAFGVPVRTVRAREEDFVRALPEAIRLAETPLYNLHPIARLLLARAARADGLTALVTGDGADEIFEGKTGRDYLPIVGALTRGAGLAIHAPFLDPGVVAGAPRDPQKRALRALAIELGVPERISLRPKTPRYAPAMDLARYWDDRRISRLARELGRSVACDHDRGRVAWTTLGLFAGCVPALEARCAA